MSAPRTVLVLYYTRGVWPLRDTIRTHLYCWRRYSRHRFLYVNIAFGFPWRLLSRLRIDAVIMHTIYLAMRWSPPIFARYTAMADAIAGLDCAKIAMPQDEFIHTDMLAEYLDRVGVTHVLTCAEPADQPTIYRRLRRPGVTFRTVLTGYLDEDTVARIDAMAAAAPPRDIDVGYRAWKAEYWLGEHGMHKVWVAERMEAAARAAGLRTDISLRQEDVLSGDDWFAFLLRCRATVGVEGGASVCDADGSIKQRVEAYLRAHPDAGFEETRAHCFAGEDHRLGLACVSPRHLEACATRTCQVLIEGGYNGILQPGVHYVPLRKDYANLDEAVATLRDPARTAAMAEAAWRDVVGSGRHTYRQFVADIEASILDGLPPGGNARDGRLAEWLHRLVDLRDRLLWRFIRLEVRVAAGGERFTDRVVRGFYAFLRPLLEPR